MHGPMNVNQPTLLFRVLLEKLTQSQLVTIFVVFVAAEIYFSIKPLLSCFSVFRAHGPPDTKQEC